MGLKHKSESTHPPPATVPQHSLQLQLPHNLGWCVSWYTPFRCLPDSIKLGSVFSSYHFPTSSGSRRFHESSPSQPKLLHSNERTPAATRQSISKKGRQQYQSDTIFCQKSDKWLLTLSNSWLSIAD